MISKDKMSVTVGVAFVWFTTQFGGGFASGNQLRQYFVQFGIWAFVTQKSRLNCKKPEKTF